MPCKQWALGLLSGLVLLFFSAAACAMCSVPYGWYLEGNFGASRISGINYPGPSSSTNSGIGGNLNLGYKFMPYFAAEIGYTQYANTTIKDQFNTKAGTGKHYSWGGWFRGNLPYYDTGFEAFAKLGLQRIYSKITVNNSTAANNIGLSNSTNSHTGLYVALGGQYYFMPEFAVNIQWAEAVGNSSTGTAQLLSIGASFIFD